MFNQLLNMNAWAKLPEIDQSFALPESKSSIARTYKTPHLANNH